MNGLQWFRMYTDFLSDPKMIAIAFEDQRHYIAVLALKAEGTLDQGGDIPVMDRIVSQRLWLDYASITDVKKRLVDAGLISEDWQPIAWEKRQKRSDGDPTNSERQRRFREKNKRNALRNKTVTPLEKSREEKSREKNGEKRTRFVPPSLSDVQDYCTQRKNSVNPQEFIDHYETNGWMRGKTKIKCWKACVRTWEKNTETSSASSYGANAI